MQRFHTRLEPRPNRRTARLTIAVCSLFAVFALFSLFPSRADATCGDYLAHAADQTHSGIMGHFPAEMGRHHNPMGKAPLRIPCHGPSCQQGPIQHPLSSPIVSFEPQDRWGWMADIALSAPVPVSFLARLSEPVVLTTIAFRLDRPPKI